MRGVFSASISCRFPIIGPYRSPPNMTRLLNHWGLGPSLDKYGHRCTQFVFNKGEPIRSLNFNSYLDMLSQVKVAS